jgi:hypothetical protein
MMKLDVRPNGDKWEINGCTDNERMINILGSRKEGAIKKVRITIEKCDSLTLSLI